MIRVRYFARLREDVGMAEEQVALPSSDATVADVLSVLRARGGRFAEALAEKRVVRVAVNHDLVKVDAHLKTGDEVAFFPPVTGG